MVCSHCKIAGHNYVTCPKLTPGQIQKIKDDKLKKKKEKEKKKIKKKEEEEAYKQRTYNIKNNNMYEVVVYWGWILPPIQGNPVTTEGRLSRLKYISPMEEGIIHANAKHRITIFPIQEVIDRRILSGDTEPPTAEEHIYDTPGDNTRFKVFDMEMKDYPYNDIELELEYKPLKSEMDQWKETALKSHFVLSQITKISGAFRPENRGKNSETLAKSFENIEVILDMVEDIKVPESCSEADKDLAGIPSTLTNIT